MSQPNLRSKFVVLPLILLTLLVMVSGSSAQNATITHSLGDQYGISAPSDWELVEEDDGAYYWLLADTIEMLLITPDQVADLLGTAGRKSTARTDANVLINVLKEFDGVEINRTEVRAVDFDDWEGVGWNYVIDTDYEGMATVFEIEGEGFLYVDFYGPYEDLDATIETVTPIITSFAVLDAEDIVTGGTSETDQSTAVETEPCIIRVSEANTAQLRVGAGENRTAVAFLPAKQDFIALGKFVTDDGTVWYKLDKAEAAPKSAANEIWVSAEQVDAEGGCDVIADASNSVVIPNTSGGGNTGGNDSSGDTGSGDTTAGTLPKTGNWTLTLDATTYASCAGTGTISFQTSEWYFLESEPFTLSIPGDGTVLLLSGDTFTQTSPGNYVGSYSFGTENTQIYVFVESSTRMTGRVVGNWTYNGVGCSVTTYHTMTYNG